MTKVAAQPLNTNAVNQRLQVRSSATQNNEDLVIHQSTSNFVAQVSRAGNQSQGYINTEKNQTNCGRIEESKETCEVSESQMIYSDNKLTNEPEIEDKKAAVKLSLRNSRSGDLRQSGRSRGSSI